MGEICKHRELALEEFHRKNFLLKTLALLHPGELQLPISYDVRVLHTGPLSFCKALDKATDGERKRSETSGVNFMPKTITGGDFA